MIKAIRHIAVFAFSLFFVYIVYNGIPGIKLRKPLSPPRGQVVVIQNDTVFADTLVLNLHKLPTVQQLHTVAKIAIGKWAKLFTVVKLEESGFDGQYSIYARKYNNLTGMRFPEKRKTTAKARGYSYYSIYENWFDCITDFKIYVDYAEESFIQQYQRKPRSEKEMIRHMYGSYNKFSKWRNDVYWLIDNFEYQ